ncbi:hypothetical protein ACFVWF_27870 [Rhodococcus qingshengii]|uniref:hypothetical protein n=1 Tax=Rhodococcus qingshengii TaxID=334542 RepID=UPI0036DBBB5D
MEVTRLRGDPLVAAFIPVALFPALIAAIVSFPGATSNGSAGESLSSSEVVQLLESTIFTVLAVFGALRIAIAHRKGALARDEVLASPAWVGRAASSLVLAAILGGFGLIAVVMTAQLAGARNDVPVLAVVTSIVACALAGLWGHWVGLIVRNPMIAMFVVPVLLVGPSLVEVLLPGMVDVSLSHGLEELSAIGSSGDGRLLGIVSTVVWLGLFAVLSRTIGGRRDAL